MFFKHRKTDRMRFGKLLLLTLALTLPIAAILPSPAARAATDTFEERAEQLLSVFASTTPTNMNNHWFFYAQARFATNTNVSTALSWVDSLNNGSHPGSMFYYVNNIETYLKFGHLYSGALKAKVKTDLTTGANVTYYTSNGSTENHKLMFKTAGYLVAQTWPDWSNASVELAGNKSELEAIMDQYVHKGLAEYDSPSYNAVTVNCLMLLAEFVQDPAFRMKAKMTLEWMLANIGAEWTNGYYVSSTLRVYPVSVTPQEGAASTIQNWLLWGGRTPSYPTSLSDHATEAHYAVSNATSTYRMPAILERIGQDRSVPYVQKENGNWNTRTSKYSYITDKFGLASQVEVQNLAWADQARRWFARWDSEEPGSTFFMTHPRLAGDYKGATIYEQVMQHNGALIGVYKIPTSGTIDGTNPILQYIEGPISTEAAKQIAEHSGWVFIHGGGTMLAVKPVKGYTWAADRTINSQTFKTLRSEYNKNGVVLEVVPASDYALAGEASLPEEDRLANELSSFKDDILANTAIDASHLDETNPRLIYTTLSGDQMDITYQYTGVYNNNRKLNGQAVAYGSWPLMDSPYMHQDYNGNTLTLNHGGESYAYDFGNWTVTSVNAPLIRWKFDEVSGVAASDSSGNGLSGSLLNGLSFGSNAVAGPVGGGALQFDGMDDVVRRDTASVSGYPFTLSAWVKTTSSANSTIQFLGNGTAFDQYVRIGMNSVGKAFLDLRNGSSTTIFSSGPVNNGQWHLITGVFENATSSKLYVDGVLQAALTNAVALPALNRMSAGALDRSVPSDRFAGAIDDVKLYTSALNASQIMALYNGN
ncbi:LamG domain-containing protein [Paenibacillus beijingensis]|uniref:Laminin G domain-containing protein n=1 Tax=Paenibacillus beijingensis TaxID=1126833 RepID=A0A0D5NPJ5_9BACL|nr:LamG domain-containing protein [Paenibacillus beijingensis]AJY76843.1 hypothetical protein VN24_22630 [Paenibacillus beijingensis]